MGTLEEKKCFDGGLLRLWNGNRQVQDTFYMVSGAMALTSPKSDPFAVFFRPSGIGFANSSMNQGNEATIFHEALHGITGLKDSEIQARLLLPQVPATCNIDAYIILNVLNFSQPPLVPGLPCGG